MKGLVEVVPGGSLARMVLAPDHPLLKLQEDSLARQASGGGEYADYDDLESCDVAECGCVPS